MARAAPAWIGEGPRIILEGDGLVNLGNAHSGVVSSTKLSPLVSAAFCVEVEVVPVEEVEDGCSGGGTSSAGALAKYLTGVLGLCCGA